MNHYEWLDKHFATFLRNLNVKNPDSYGGMGASHGDKCYQYRDAWKNNGVPFNHGVAIYMLTYILPYSKSVRDTKNGWIDPFLWVINTYAEFKLFLPSPENQ